MKGQRKKCSESKLKKFGQCTLIYISTVLLVIFVVFGIPLIINELYQMRDGYKTLWGAADVLSYYSEILNGVISIGALVVTIIFTRKDTEKQIRITLSQFNVPFFLIDSVCDIEKSASFSKTKNGRSWTSDFFISRHDSNPTTVNIVLLNIGDGIAISPSYKMGVVDIADLCEETYVEKGEKIKLNYKLYNVLESRFGPQLFPEKDQAFDIEITLYYQNISGIVYSQNVLLHHICKVNNNTVSISISEITPQKLE